MSKKSLAASILTALAMSGCTVLLPTTAVVMGGHNADISVDDRGCERVLADGRCVRPGPVKYGTTVLVNALVGFAIDAALVASAAQGLSAD